MNSISNSENHLSLPLEGFKVYEIGIDKKDIPNYVRKDFYKICITDGEFIIRYESKTFVTSGNILFFGSPHIPYSCQAISTSFKGYACVFNENFLRRYSSPSKASIINETATSLIINLDNEKYAFITDKFRKMIDEMIQPTKDSSEKISLVISNLIDLLSNTE